jgi:hypothetical protein
MTGAYEFTDKYHKPVRQKLQRTLRQALCRFVGMHDEPASPNHLLELNNALDDATQDLIALGSELQSALLLRDVMDTLMSYHRYQPGRQADMTTLLQQAATRAFSHLKEQIPHDHDAMPTLIHDRRARTRDSFSAPQPEGSICKTYRVRRIRRNRDNLPELRIAN